MLISAKEIDCGVAEHLLQEVTKSALHSMRLRIEARPNDVDHRIDKDTRSGGSQSQA